MLSDFVQVPPERTVTVSRLDEHEARIVVTGPVPHRAPQPADGPAGRLLAIAANRYLVGRLQKADSAVPGDLGWITVDVQPLGPAGASEDGVVWSWGCVVGSPDEPIPLLRPGPERSDWRVTVEEWERFPGDPDPDAPPAILIVPVWEQRLVFADEIYL